MCFNPSPERRVPSPNRYMAFAKFCFCKNNKRTIDRCRVLLLYMLDIVGYGTQFFGMACVRAPSSLFRVFLGV
jgi:hypothetical protein